MTSAVPDRMGGDPSFISSQYSQSVMRRLDYLGRTQFRWGIMFLDTDTQHVLRRTEGHWPTVNLDSIVAVVTFTDADNQRWRSKRGSCRADIARFAPRRTVVMERRWVLTSARPKRGPDLRHDGRDAPVVGLYGAKRMPCGCALTDPFGPAFVFVGPPCQTPRRGI
jgi:hypothetical protein